MRGHRLRNWLIHGASRSSVVVVGALRVHSATVGTGSEVAVATWSLEVVVHHSSAIKVSLNVGEDLLDDLNGVRSLKNVRVDVGLGRLSAVEEISLVLSLSLKLSTGLGKLVVGNIQRLAIDVVVVAIKASIGSTVRSLVANEGSRCRLLLIAGNDLDALNLTERCEEFSKLLLIEISREAFDEEVALLLGVLISLLVTSELSIADQSWEGGLSIDGEAIDFFPVNVSYGLISAVSTVVMLTFFVKADESIRLLVAILVLALSNKETLDISISAEECSQLLLFPSWVEILHVDVVEALLNIVAVSGLIADNSHAFKSLSRNCSPGTFLRLEANEAVPVGLGRLCSVDIEALATFVLDNVRSGRNFG